MTVFDFGPILDRRTANENATAARRILATCRCPRDLDCRCQEKANALTTEAKRLRGEQ
jgi:hypothetical protein